MVNLKNEIVVKLLAKFINANVNIQILFNQQKIDKMWWFESSGNIYCIQDV